MRSSLRAIPFLFGGALAAVAGCGDDTVTADGSADFSAAGDLAAHHDLGARDLAVAHDSGPAKDFAVAHDMTTIDVDALIDATIVDLAPMCIADLSNIGAGDFQIRVILNTTQAGNVAILNQRAACADGSYWDLRMENGNVVFETDEIGDGGANHVTLTGCLPINTGNHLITIQRVGGKLADFIDGILDASPVISTASFATLPAVASGNDVCIGVDGTVAFDNNNGMIGAPCFLTTFTPMFTGGLSFCMGGD